METSSGDTSMLVVLAEPQRARVYDYLIASEAPATVAEVSRSLGIGRTLAAFHLDRLQAAGLVAAVADEPTGPRGRGRPAQRYRAVFREISAAVPPRRYDVLAEILVSTVSEQGSSESFRAAGLRVARRRGRELAQLHEGGAPRFEVAQEIRTWLSEFGYQPGGEGTIVADNCPFSRLRDLDTELVCSLNVALVQGYLDGLDVNDRFLAVLRPNPPHCCVVVESTA